MKPTAIVLAAAAVAAIQFAGPSNVSAADGPAVAPRAAMERPAAASSRPAEFVVIRIGQKTLQAPAPRPRSLKPAN